MQIIDAHHRPWGIENRRRPRMKGPESVRIRGPNARLRKNYLAEDFPADVRNRNVVKSVRAQADRDDAARTRRI